MADKFPKRLSRVLDGKRDSLVVNSADEQRTAEMKGWFVDENQDGVPDAAPTGGGEYPKDLHGTVNGAPVSKTVHDATEEAAARKAGWSSTPKQDHGPTGVDLDVPEPVLDGAKGKKK